MKWMFKTPRGMKLDDAMRLAAEAGYDGAEIQLYDLPDDRGWMCETVKRIRETGFPVTVHAPSGDINLSSSNQGIRRESFRQVQETIRLAGELGALAVTIHPGRLSSMRETGEKQIGWMEEAFIRLAEQAEREQVVIGMENMELRPKEIYTSIESMNRLLDLHSGACSGLTLDFAHLYTVDREMTLSELRHRICNVHISQCVGGKAHFGLTAEGGEISVKACIEKLRKIRYEGTVVIEAKDSGSLEAARNNLRLLKAAEGSWEG